MSIRYYKGWPKTGNINAPGTPFPDRVEVENDIVLTLLPEGAQETKQLDMAVQQNNENEMRRLEVVIDLQQRTINTLHAKVTELQNQLPPID